MGKIIDWAMEALGLAENTDEEMNEEAVADKEATDKRRTRPARASKSEIREADKKADSSSGYSWSKPTYSTEAKRSKVVNMGGSSISSLSAMNMVIQQPTEYNNAKEIAVTTSALITGIRFAADNKPFTRFFE